MRFVLLTFLAFRLVSGATAPPRTGWVLTKGGEDLINGAFWPCLPHELDAQLNVLNGALTAVAGENYLGGVNLLAPSFRLTGDFGVSATLKAAAGAGGWISLNGSLNTGPESWQGRKRLEFGIHRGAVVADLWDGTQPTPTLYRTFTPAPLSGTVNLEAVKQGTQIIVYVNGAEAGRMEDIGVFSKGNVYLGILVPPGQQMTVEGLSFEVPQGSQGTVQVILPLGNVAASGSGQSLRSLTSALGLTIGTAVRPWQIASGAGFSATFYPGGAPDPSFRHALVQQFNALTNEWLLMSQSHPAPARYDFCVADAALSFAQANTLPVHGHALVSNTQGHTPDWVVAAASSRNALIAVLRDHVQTLVSRYRGQLSSWDVVNEAIAADGSIRADTVWGSLIGPDYIDMAFQFAHQADPDTKLFYNDYGAENRGAKADGVYNLVRGLLSRGVPIDGVGMQSHFAIDSGSSSLPSYDDVVFNMRRLGDLGLEVRISEMDVRLQLPISDTELRLQAQAFGDLMRACLASSNCKSFNMWGADDAASWIDAFYPGFGGATLFDTAFRPKPASQSVMNLLMATAWKLPTSPRLTQAGIVNAASFAGGPVSPGEIVTLFAANVGPGEIVVLQIAADGRVSTWIGDTRVLFDGVAAPMIYTLAGQISAIVPYSVTGKTTTQVQVEYKGVPSPPVTISVAAAAPGIFTAYPSGRGEAAMLNESGCCNTPLSPAARGSIVTVFATGEGQTAPTGVDGRLAEFPRLADFPRPLLPVTVTVGGLPAKVEYAGAAPGYVAGLMQVNFRVPEAVAPSNAVPVMLTVGTVRSPAGVTMAVR